jgi:TetR/AcrR family transcriptional regulator, tetracycline repressor protein
MAMKKNKENKQGNDIPREPLDKDKIVQTALELINEVGLQKLTTRRLAEAIGIRSASLYWHVRDKSELLQLLAESICSRLHMPDPSLTWQEQMISFSREYRLTLLSIRDSAEVLLETPPMTPKRLLLMEAMLSILAKADFPPEEIVMASMLVNDYVLSFVRDEALMSRMEIPDDYFHCLSAEQYPTVLSLAQYMVFDMNQHFEYGLKLLLSGFEAKLKSKSDNRS